MLQIKRLGTGDQIGSLGDAVSKVFPSLKMIHLPNNGLQRLADLELFRIMGLRAVFLQENRLTDISGNFIKIVIKPMIGYYISIEETDCGGESLTDTVVADIPSWVSILVMDRNKMSIPFITCSSESCLSDLLLEGNFISKLAFVEYFRGLRRLFIARNRILVSYKGQKKVAL